MLWVKNLSAEGEHREHWHDFSAASISKKFTTEEHN